MCLLKHRLPITTILSATITTLLSIILTPTKANAFVFDPSKKAMEKMIATAGINSGLLPKLPGILTMGLNLMVFGFLLVQAVQIIQKSHNGDEITHMIQPFVLTLIGLTFIVFIQNLLFS